VPFSTIEMTRARAAGFRSLRLSIIVADVTA